MAKQLQFSRRGPDHRGGEQVTFLDVKQHFGLGHVRVGRWVSSEESLIAANLMFDALADLALVLKLSPAVIGLSERLNLAYGHGGREGVMAHYAPMERTLALAKHAGAGALAHEYWHALDHHLADVAFADEQQSSSRALFATERWLKDIKLKPHPLNQCLERLFAQVFLSADGEESHPYVRRAIALDSQFGRLYFAHPSELMARAFEATIQRHGTYDEIDRDSGEILPSRLISPFLVCGAAPNEAISKELLSAGAGLLQSHHSVADAFGNYAYDSGTFDADTSGSGVSGSGKPSWGEMPHGAFPDAWHLDEIATYLFGYFSLLGTALERKFAKT
ncbi:hypothetical protein KJI95_14170 [Shewanella sp. JM162201]|uniref:Large polyvalent protein-associated domain-containing protein n=1 Tax=Shewanella jiangmenensis TaxID=2837387 RepID=A0ABS5V5B5_9GAMM|nr:CLCA_X family protein [Shewanella jiangmenensis]MBT1445656.1 hypothetical protein [Shewanella jiangmenensis]